MKQKVKTSEEFDNIDSSCTDDESGDGQSSLSHKDKESDVSFESDNDEAIDTTEIEEEDWVDYIKKEAPTKPEKRWEMKRLDAGTRLTKNEMETGAENCHITEREMVDKSC